MGHRRSTMTKQEEIEKAAKRRRTFEVIMLAVAMAIVENQVRQDATAAADAQLTSSIKALGILQPVGFRGDRKTLVYGHRRLRCAVAAGLTEIPAVVLPDGMTEAESLSLQLSENIQRESLSQFDLFQGCLRLIETCGFQQRDLARVLSLDPAQVSPILSAAKVIPEAVAALKAKQINLGHTYALSKVDSTEEQARLLNLALAGASRDNLEGEVRKLNARRKAQETIRLSRVKLQLPGSKVCLILSGADLSMDDVAEALAEAQKEVRRARDQQMDVRAFNAVMSSKAKSA